MAETLQSSNLVFSTSGRSSSARFNNRRTWGVRLLEHQFTLPASKHGQAWLKVLDTNEPPPRRNRRRRQEELAAGAQLQIGARSIVALQRAEPD
jgi:hypothetical protein